MPWSQAFAVYKTVSINRQLSRSAALASHEPVPESNMCHLQLLHLPISCCQAASGARPVMACVRQLMQCLHPWFAV